MTEWKYQKLIHWLGLPIALFILTVLLITNEWLSRWDQLLYDTHLQWSSTPAPEDIIIVAIDEKSLAQLGRWPWPRRLHANLVEQLSKSGAAAIGLDIVFAEADLQDPQGDFQLSKAIANSANVVLPVLVEQPRLSALLKETLPLPALIQASAGLGHVHVELDTDGIARSTYLKEGLGQSTWHHFSIALLEIRGITLPQLPGSRAPDTSNTSPFLWQRDHHLLIPFLGPPGHFPRISYAQVINGDFPPDTFRGKTVLVGVTAAGLGDSLPTPVSGLNQAMPGVEINANILAALQLKKTIQPLSITSQGILASILILLATSLFPLLGPRGALLLTLSFMLITLILTSLLLWLGHVWFPPSSLLLTLAISYPLWSWRRLEFTMHYLNQELIRLNQEPALLTQANRTTLNPTMAFLKRLMPIEGWRLESSNGVIKAAWGNPVACSIQGKLTGDWTPTEKGYACRIIRNDTGTWYWFIAWANTKPPTSQQTDLLWKIIEPYITKTTTKPHSTLAVVQERVQQVQEATERLRSMRSFISNSLEQMADGVLVINALGEILLHNSRAVHYLGLGTSDEMSNIPFHDLLSSFRVSDGISWDHCLTKVLLEGAVVQQQIRNAADIDLFIQLSPLQANTGTTQGIVITFSDISMLKASERKRAELLSFLSHDLRSPLISLLAITDLMKRKEDAPTSSEDTNQIEHYANYTLELANDFLHLARVESAEPLIKETHDLVAVASNALNKVWVQAAAKSIKLQSHFDQPIAWNEGDPSLLERAIVNLLTNAINYSPNNSGEIILTISQNTDYLICCIKDNGYGIEPDDLDKIFMRFHRVRQTQQNHKEGSGLGLAFVKATAEAHGGTVTVNSKLGVGSEFCLFLPLGHQNRL